MAPTTPDPKRCALADSGTVNPHPEAVRDPSFAGSDFFDPRDLVQVEYEMLRGVRVEHACMAEVAEQFGLSRPTFYKAQADSARAGLTGLLPGKRGPRGAHKITPAVLRGSLVGTLVGILPGLGATLASFLAYTWTRQSSRCGWWATLLQHLARLVPALGQRELANVAHGLHALGVAPGAQLRAGLARRAAELGVKLDGVALAALEEGQEEARSAAS